MHAINNMLAIFHDYKGWCELTKHTNNGGLGNVVSRHQTLPGFHCWTKYCDITRLKISYAYATAAGHRDIDGDRDAQTGVKQRVRGAQILSSHVQGFQVHSRASRFTGFGKLYCSTQFIIRQIPGKG